MYVVVENTPGYLPENDNPIRFDTLEEAQEYARELADDVATLSEDPAQVVSQESPTLWRIISDAPHDLGRVVEILDTQEAGA